MQSKTVSFLAELEVYDVEERRSRSFKLYEEYSHKPIADTIKEAEKLWKSHIYNQKQLLDEVEREVKNFRSWLEETKKLTLITL